jgi:serine/threonine protein kinase
MKNAIESTTAKLRFLLGNRGIVTDIETIETKESGNDNVIKIKNYITTIADADCSLAYDELARMVTHIISHGRHTDFFPCLKTYRKSKKTGVFNADNRFIIKYDTYTDLRLLKTYKKLGNGINETYKIVTPTWYSFIKLNKTMTVFIDDVIVNNVSESFVTKHADDDTDDDDHDNKINMDDIMTLEMQPMLQESIVFHEWYRKTHFNTQDHDGIITNMMLSVAKSIKYCHDMDLVHGDIKPDNLMVIREARTRDDARIMHRNHRVPDIYLIDFGMCGRENIDEGTGGTRPYCAPETNNVNNVQQVLAHNLKERTRQNNGVQVSAVSGDEYVWSKLTKAQDVWSFGIILFTLVSYYNVYHYYREYPMRTFDRAGFVRDCELANNPDISDHALYPVLSKMLCTHDKRATIDEVISMMDAALVDMNMSRDDVMVM